MPSHGLGRLHFLDPFFQHADFLSHILYVASQFEENLVENLAFVLKRVVTLAMDGSQLRGFRILGDKLAEHISRNQSLWREDGNLLGDIFQLAHVARPLIMHEQLLGILIEHHTIHLVFLSHLHGKQAEQQHDVLTTFAQWRHLDGDRIQAVIQILTETPFADSLLNIHVGSGYDANISFAHLGSTYRDIFARFEHTQQSCLRSQRQLSHFIEKQRTLIGHTEITGRIVDSTRKRTLNMAEELRVDSALWDRTAVDGEILLTSAWRIVVNHTRNDFLTHTAFSHNQHGEISRCHLKGDIERMVQCIAVTYDIVPLFDTLKF